MPPLSPSCRGRQAAQAELRSPELLAGQPRPSEKACGAGALPGRRCRLSLRSAAAAPGCRSSSAMSWHTAWRRSCSGTRAASQMRWRMRKEAATVLRQAPATAFTGSRCAPHRTACATSRSVSASCASFVTAGSRASSASRFDRLNCRVVSCTNAALERANATLALRTRTYSRCTPSAWDSAAFVSALVAEPRLARSCCIASAPRSAAACFSKAASVKRSLGSPSSEISEMSRRQSHLQLPLERAACVSFSLWRSSIIRWVRAVLAARAASSSSSTCWSPVPPSARCRGEATAPGQAELPALGCCR
mmetsp:Transcript_48864/g.141538  ORF Transcript_48864/g.141538 Transcript_48864/m.141538 type:complete len:306 (+) Transcript_48864:90-1007(+)